MVITLNPNLQPIIQSDGFLPRISRWTTLGGIFLVATFGSAITIAYFTPYNVIVKAPATARPAGELKIVQATTEGPVKHVIAKENQTVNQGDIIAYIDDSQLQTKKNQLQGSIQNIRLQLLQIDAQSNALETQSAAESNSMDLAIAAAQTDIERQQRDYQDKKIITNAEHQDAVAAQELAKSQLTANEQLAKHGAISRMALKEKQQAYAAAASRLKRTQAALNPSNAVVKLAQEQVGRERARGESTLAALNKQRQELLQRRVEIQNQMSRDTRELQQIGKELQKTIIRAPETGTILKLNIRNEGQFFRAAETIAQIAPSNASLVIKAQVLAQDRGKVEIGQKVKLRVSAYAYPDYGILEGKVVAIASDITATQNNDSEGSKSANYSAATPYYEVTIQPGKTYFIKGARQYPLELGMEATADIISREETVLTFILRKAKLLADL